MAPQYSIACSSISGDRAFPVTDSFGGWSFLVKLRVVSQTSFISSRHSTKRKAENATFPRDGFNEALTCIGLISRGVESSLLRES